ncbi:MAG: amidohydrolase family protein [Acidimicrobiaceae bacterium]|nr:amidohydrolase family protein [Acidimicrobiaceae bacterium]MYE09962.1 amidohydrolase family protein [Acidimicrobiaceae bacterium]
MFDLLIQGGDVIDGRGGPRRRADIGIVGDRISAIGNLVNGGAEAAAAIDATGLAVTPGFIDVHTHFDAQVFWDPDLSPSPLHGVTTVIGGNCGFTIAPLGDDPAHGDYLMRMLARVEGIPLEALQQGVPWSWQTTAEYFDAIDGNVAVNAGFKVGHSALRRVVMGGDSVRRVCTDEELEAMKGLLRDGLEAGALGFSSSWSRTHNDPMGNMVPSRYAERDELIALCSVLAGYDGTSVEFNPALRPFEPWAFDLMADMSAAARRPLNWNVLAVNARSLETNRAELAAGDQAAARGGKIVALTVPLTLSLHLNFNSGFVLDALPGWEEVMLLGKEEKLRVLADPAERRRLDELAQGDHPLRRLAHWATKVVFHSPAPENEGCAGRTVGEIAEERGQDPWDTLCDMAVADDLETSFGNPAMPEPTADWEARVEIWREPLAVIGASDAGAHLDLFLSANYATTMLGEAVVKRGLIPLEEAVHLLTEVPADLYGLVDRGVLAEGAHADIVVLDEATVGSGPTTFRSDLPAGASRLYAEATGIEHVVCNGAEIVRGGQFTGARPGTLMRSGTHTTGPSLD